MKILLLLLFTLFIEAKSSQQEYMKLLESALNNATPIQKNILQNAKQFLQKKTIIKGSCWDYINAIYTEAKVTQKARLFNSKKSGPYAPLELIQKGDWLYHVNHSYGDVGHSGMFIAWVDRAAAKALMLSYAGEHKARPGRLRIYHIDQVFGIMRPKNAAAKSKSQPTHSHKKALQEQLRKIDDQIDQLNRLKKEIQSLLKEKHE